jgi:hypothetical protein
MHPYWRLSQQLEKPLALNMERSGKFYSIVNNSFMKHCLFLSPHEIDKHGRLIHVAAPSRPNLPTFNDACWL